MKVRRKTLLLPIMRYWVCGRMKRESKERRILRKGKEIYILIEHRESKARSMSDEACAMTVFVQQSFTS